MCKRFSVLDIKVCKKNTIELTEKIVPKFYLQKQTLENDVV